MNTNTLSRYLWYNRDAMREFSQKNCTAASVFLLHIDVHPVQQLASDIRLAPSVGVKQVDAAVKRTRLWIDARALYDFVVEVDVAAI